MYVLPLLMGDPFHTPAGNGTGLHPSADRRTVYDPAAGVTWLADADLARTQTFGVAGIDDGSMQEPTAVEWIKAMDEDTPGSAGRTGGSPGNSRCGGFDCGPNAGPLGQLYYVGLGLAKGTPVVPTPVTTLHGFRDVQPYLYWSCAAGTVQGPCVGEPVPNQEWSFSFGNGFKGTDLLQGTFVMVDYPGR